MKKCYQHLLFILICGFISPVFAQTPIYIGKVNEVRATYANKVRPSVANQASSEALVSHSIPGEKPLLLKLLSSRQDRGGVIFYGEVKDATSGRFYLKVSNGQASGAIAILDQKKYYRYSSKADGSVYLTKENIDKVLCVNMPKAKEVTRQGQSSQSATSNISNAALEAVPLLESLPGAGAVLYLDFDGETVSNTEWNRTYTNGEPIVAAPALFTASEMTEAWKLMSEDFRPFALNVTTNVSVFNNAPVNRRMRIIFTSTQEWFPGSVGGVAYIGSFTWGGIAGTGDTPCWVFNGGIKGGGETGSHEAGHTMGLGHDGRIDPTEEYFYGQDSWAPIMGAGFNVRLVQWSKGEYPNASNSEDDLNIIATSNGFGYRPDDHGNTIATATPLVMDASGNISATANKGIITTRTDVDVFSFTSAGGKIAFTVTPTPEYSNLDILVTLRNAAGTVIASDDPPVDEGAAISATLVAGTYYISIDGVQGGLGANSDYASLGTYIITPGKEYCTPVYNGGCEVFADMINNFSFNSLVNNNSGCSGNTANSYSLYAPTGTFTTTVIRGQSYSLQLQGAVDEGQNFGVWIDYNQDNDFGDAGEFVYATSFASTNLFSATITIPTTAALGATRLRVRSNINTVNSVDYCQPLEWGEAEDYTITIAANVPTDSKPIIVHGNKGTVSGVTSLTVAPNPVRNNARIDLSVSQNLQINLTIYDQKGNVVRQLYNGAVNAGAQYHFSWNTAGKANGAYVLQLTTATGVMTRKIIVAPGGKE